MTMNTDSASGTLPGAHRLGWRGARMQQVLGGLFDALGRDIAHSLARQHDWKLMVLAGSDGLKLFHKRRGSVEQLASAGDAFTDEAVAILNAAAKRVRARRDETVLRLAPGKVVIKELTLPQAAGEYVPVIVRNRIERLAPWPLSEAVFGHQLAQQPGPAGQIVVRIAITGRRVIDGLRTGLARAGIVPGRTEVGEDAASGDPIALSTSTGELEHRIARILKLAVLALVLFLVALSAVGLHWSYAAWRDLSAVDIRIAELQRKLSGSQAATARERSTMAAIERLIMRKATEQPFSAVLGQLTGALPDGSWLTEVSYRRPELTVTGKSASVPSLVKALETEPMFADANFAAPTRREPMEQIDTFSIRMTVLPGQGGPQ